MSYKPGVHCRLDYITENDLERLPQNLRARLDGVLGNMVGRRLTEVVKELRASGDGETATVLVRSVRESR